MRKNRQAAIEKEIMKIVGKVLFDEIKNPKLRGMLSVTRVTMTPDGKYADVMVSQLIINKEIDKLETDKELSKLNSYVRKRLGENLDLRYVPEVRMKFDDSIEYGVRINKLINEL